MNARSSKGGSVKFGSCVRKTGLLNHRQPVHIRLDADFGADVSQVFERGAGFVK